jgi:hypothetical protein
MVVSHSTGESHEYADPYDRSPRHADHEALDAVTGGKEERHKVTHQEYERILARIIADSKKK